MRTAVSRAENERKILRRSNRLIAQFAKLVQATPVSTEIQEWFVNERMAEGTKRSWKKDRSSSRHSRHRNRVGGNCGGRMDHVRRTKCTLFPGTATAKKIAERGGDDAAFGIRGDGDGGRNPK